MNDIKIYTLKEVEDILKVSQRTLYNYIKHDKLRASKVGNQWRVRHEDLQEFIDKGTN